MWDDRFFPKVEDQCLTDACVAWSVGYYAKTFFVYRDWVAAAPSRSVLQKPRAMCVSPSWVFNNINEGMDEGQAIGEAVVLLKIVGAALVKHMPISCDPGRPPTAYAIEQAAKRKTPAGRSPRKFRTAAEGPIDLPAVQDYLRRLGPVVFMLRVDAGFSNRETRRTDGGRDTAYEPGDADAPPTATSYRHAMCCTGYDPTKQIGDHPPGAYRFVNSFGTRWRDRGRVWIAAEVLPSLSPTAYALEDDDVVLASRPWDRLDGLTAVVAGNALDDASKGKSAVPRAVESCRDSGDPEKGCPILRDVLGAPVVFYDGDVERTIAGPWRPPASWYPTRTVVRILGADGELEDAAREWQDRLSATSRTQASTSTDGWARDVFMVPRELVEELLEEPGRLYLELHVEMTRRDAQHRVADRRRYRLVLVKGVDRPVRFLPARG